MLHQTKWVRYNLVYTSINLIVKAMVRTSAAEKKEDAELRKAIAKAKEEDHRAQSPMNQAQPELAERRVLRQCEEETRERALDDEHLRARRGRRDDRMHRPQLSRACSAAHHPPPLRGLGSRGAVGVRTPVERRPAHAAQAACGRSQGEVGPFYFLPSVAHLGEQSVE